MKAMYALMITEGSMVIGGGVTTKEALFLNSDLQSGHSKACAVFESPTLLGNGKEKFDVMNVELYVVCDDLV